jgi:hypothetical protein
LLAVAALLLFAASAHAQSLIRQPDAHTRYVFEAEPHALFGPFGPPALGGGTGLGAGFRGTVQILSPGFIPRLNNSVGIGFGADYLHYDDDGPNLGRCARFVPAPDGTSVCVETEPGDGGDTDYLIFPVVLQWTFWFTRQWSAFGEPGLMLHLRDGDDFGFSPFVLYAGGRFQFSDMIALTLRLGYPTFSLGVSFFL